MKNKTILGSLMCCMGDCAPLLFPVHTGRTVVAEARAWGKARKNCGNKSGKQRRRESAL